METQTTVPAAEYCEWYKIEISFIQALEQCGLLQTTVINDILCLQIEQLPELEKYTRLHYVMQINLEGIETVAHLLNRMSQLQKETLQLRNRLAVYEG